MQNRFLAFFVLGILAVIVFIFFFFRTQPVMRPKPAASNPSRSEQTAPSVTFVNPARGTKTPRVTLVEFGDFACGPCKQAQSILEQVLARYPDEVQLVWKDLPNDSTHPEATRAAVAAHCADRQGKFWEYGNALFDRQTFLSDTQYAQIATDLGLNLSKFSACFTNQETLGIVSKDREEGIALGVVATPAVFVGTELLVGLPSIDELSRLIDQQRLTHEPTP